MQKILEEGLLNKGNSIPTELQEPLSKHTDPEKAPYYGQFHKSHISYCSMQTYRLIIAIVLNTPIWFVSFLVKGIDYVIMYATQWVAVTTTGYFLLCWIAAKKEVELEAKLKEFTFQKSNDAETPIQANDSCSENLDQEDVEAAKHALADAEYWNYMACKMQNITVAW